MRRVTASSIALSALLLLFGPVAATHADDQSDSRQASNWTTLLTFKKAKVLACQKADSPLDGWFSLNLRHDARKFTVRTKLVYVIADLDGEEAHTQSPWSRKAPKFYTKFDQSKSWNATALYPSATSPADVTITVRLLTRVDGRRVGSEPVQVNVSALSGC